MHGVNLVLKQIYNKWRKTIMKLIKKSNELWVREHIATKLTELATDSTRLLCSNKGYVIAPQKINRCLALTDLEVRLLLELMSNMGFENYAYPGHKYLAFKLGKKSITSIKKTLKSLQKKGFIEWEKGGGDLGTNHYWVKDLYYNPYLIMSEATFYCVDKILGVYRGEISYEGLYGAVQNFIDPEKGAKSYFEAYAEHLFEFPEDRDVPTLYSTYCDNLVDHIEEKTGFSINIIWETLINREFESKFADAKFGENGLLMFLINQNLIDRAKVIEEKFGYHLSKDFLINFGVEEGGDNIDYGAIIEEVKELAESSSLKCDKALLKGKLLTDRLLALKQS
jgi:predicted transcriptional regulator